MDRRTIMGNLKKHIFLDLSVFVFTADLFKWRYGAKYLRWSVVRYLYKRTRVVMIICCLIGSQ